jgi:hypothetical protein
MRKPLMVSLHRSLADGSENVSGYFCGNVRRTVPQKPEELKRAAGQTNKSILIKLLSEEYKIYAY